MTASESEIFLRGDESALKLPSSDGCTTIYTVMVAQQYIHTKSY